LLIVYYIFIIEDVKDLINKRIYFKGMELRNIIIFLPYFLVYWGLELYDISLIYFAISLFIFVITLWIKNETWMRIQKMIFRDVYNKSEYEDIKREELKIEKKLNRL
jgi:hypothetical protein